MFLILPGRKVSVEVLRDDYLAGLRRYENVKYVWGGEGALGIDCSGLIRRGLVDALFLRGVRTANPALVRESLKLWWHDTSAKALGEHLNGITVPIADTRTLNQFDHSVLKPGDLAVTTSGIHIMAYLGENGWIEADPGVEKVITMVAKSDPSSWLDNPMHIVRWKILSE